MPRILHTEIEIAAPAERVWEILSDFAAYHRWNPLLRGMRGNLAERNRLRVNVRLAWWFRMIIHPIVLRVEPPRLLCWRGSLLVPSMFEGVHEFRVNDFGEGKVKLIQSETFGGLLMPVIPAVLFDLMHRGFEKMNTALKEVAESSH